MTEAWLTTSRLDFAPLAPAHVAPLADALAADPTTTTGISGWSAARATGELSGTDDGAFRAVLLRGDEPVGALIGRPHGETLALDGFVVPTWRGVGYAPEALVGVLRRVFGADGSPRAYEAVTIVVSAGNVAAIRAARAAGFEATPIAGARRPDGLRGDTVRLVATTLRPMTAPIDGARARRWADTLQGFEATRLADALTAAVSAPPRRSKPVTAADPLAPVLARAPRYDASDGDVAAALEACRYGGVRDELLEHLGRVAFSDAQIARLQGALLTGHSAATEYGDALANDALLRRYRAARGPR